MDKTYSLRPFIYGGVAVALLVVALILNPLVVVGAGERGVVFDKARGVQGDVLGEGLHFRTPFVQSVKKIPVRTQSAEADLIASSIDNQTVTYKATINYHIDPNQAAAFYQQIGDTDEKTIESKFIVPDANQALKVYAPKLSADESIPRQQETRAQSLLLMQQDMAKYHLIVDDLIIRDIDFTDQYNNAVEAKAEAKQAAEQSQYLKQKAQNEADATLVTASASAKAAVIQAQGQSDANKLLQVSISPELLEKMSIEKWDGSVPQYVGNGSVVPFINLNK